MARLYGSHISRHILGKRAISSYISIYDDIWRAISMARLYGWYMTRYMSDIWRDIWEPYKRAIDMARLPSDMANEWCMTRYIQAYAEWYMIWYDHMWYDHITLIDERQTSDVWRDIYKHMRVIWSYIIYHSANSHRWDIIYGSFAEWYMTRVIWQKKMFLFGISFSFSKDIHIEKWERYAKNDTSDIWYHISYTRIIYHSSYESDMAKENLFLLHILQKKEFLLPYHSTRVIGDEANETSDIWREYNEWTRYIGEKGVYSLRFWTPPLPLGPIVSDI